MANFLINGQSSHSVDVEATDVIRVGDLLWLDEEQMTEVYGESASSFTWNTNIATTQEEFHDKFLGVSQGQRIALQTEDGMLDYAAAGICRGSCDALTEEYEIGTFVGIAKAAGNALDSQKVVIVATVNLAIGRLSAPARIGATVLEYEFISTIIYGGPQAPA